MGAIFGILTSLAVSGSELFGRKVALRAEAVTISIAIQSLAMITSLITALVLGDVIGMRDLTLGAVSGIGFGVGMMAYLHGLTKASSAIIAPTVATLSALLPFS